MVASHRLPLPWSYRSCPQPREYPTQATVARENRRLKKTTSRSVAIVGEPNEVYLQVPDQQV